MKKALSILASALLILTAFSGCAGKNGEKTVVSEETTAAQSDVKKQNERVTENEEAAEERTDPTAPEGAKYGTELLCGTWKTETVLTAAKENADAPSEISIFENSAAYWFIHYPSPESGEEIEDGAIMYYDVEEGNIGDCEAGWYAFLSAGQNGEILVKAELKDEETLYIDVKGPYEFTALCKRSDKSDAAEYSLEGRRKLMLNDDIAAGIVYLGKAESFDRINVLELLYKNEKMSVLSCAAHIPENKYIDAGGTDVFCVIPFADDASVAVNGLEADGSVSDVFYRSEAGDPILVACEAQDGNAHIQLNVCDHRTNGTINITLLEPNGILDTTDSPEFADMTIYRDIDTENLISSLRGDWAAAVTAPDGSEYELMLTFTEDGAMEYAYGYPMSDILERFGGIFYVKKLNAFSQYAPGEISFQLRLNGGLALENTEPYDFYGEFILSISDDGKLHVLHTAENCLIYGMDGGEFVFSRAIG